MNRSFLGGFEVSEKKRGRKKGRKKGKKGKKKKVRGDKKEKT